MDAKINPRTNRSKDWKDLLKTISEENKTCFGQVSRQG